MSTPVAVHTEPFAEWELKEIRRWAEFPESTPTPGTVAGNYLRLLDTIAVRDAMLTDAREVARLALDKMRRVKEMCESVDNFAIRQLLSECAVFLRTLPATHQDGNILIELVRKIEKILKP